MIVTRVGPMSFARISGILYAIVGFVVGCAVSVASVTGGVAAEGAEAAGLMAFGAAAVFFLPLFYGFLGFMSSLIGAFLYNIFAGMIGGIEIELKERGSE